MIAKTSVQKFFYALFGFVMSIVMLLGSEYVGPSTTTPIKAESPKNVKAVFALIADPQVSNYLVDRYPVFKAASEDLHNAKCKFDAVIGVGDITENGLATEYQLVYDGISGLDTRYIMATGNHDVRLRDYNQVVERFTNFANNLNGDEAMTSLHFSEKVGGYKVIVLGSDRTEFEEAYLSDEQLTWLNTEIKKEKGKPVFVICHQPLKDTHNVDVAWNSSIEGKGTVGEQSDALQSILSKYKNVFFISGHLHSGFGPDSYNNVDGIHCINVPSMAIDNMDGTYNNPGTGYIVEVYKNKVIFRARDYAQGVWVSESTGNSSYDITISLK